MPDTPVIATNSSQRGFLPPGPGLFRLTFDVQGEGLDQGYFNAQPPLEGQSLEDFMQNIIAGITQLPPNMVRPRWQREPPNIPDRDVDWCAIGITGSDPEDGWAYLYHDPSGDGRDTVMQHESFDVLCSFYGPNAEAYSGLLRDGFQVPQNREVLQLNAMGLVRVSGNTRAPALLKNEWLERTDRTVTIHRQIRRQYPVLNIKSIPYTITTVNGDGSHSTSGTVTSS